MKKIIAFKNYILARLDERSTIMLIGAGVGVASALPAPWSYVSMALAVIAALVPDGSVTS